MGVYFCDTLDDLRAIDALANNTAAFVFSELSLDDPSQPAQYRWDAALVAADNGMLYIRPNSSDPADAGTWVQVS